MTTIAGCVDWQIVKENPQIYIGVGQEDVGDVMVCSSCGRLLPLSQFPSHHKGQMGVSRNCKDCSRARKRPTYRRPGLTVIIETLAAATEQPASRSMEQPMAEAGPLFAAAG